MRNTLGQSPLRIDFRTVSGLPGRVTAPESLKQGDIVILLEQTRFCVGISQGVTRIESAKGVKLISRVAILDYLGSRYDQFVNMADRKFADTVVRSVEPTSLRGLFFRSRRRRAEILARQVSKIIGSSLKTEPFEHERARLGQTIYSVGFYGAGLSDVIKTEHHPDGHVTYDTEPEDYSAHTKFTVV